MFHSDFHFFPLFCGVCNGKGVHLSCTLRKTILVFVNSFQKSTVRVRPIHASVKKKSSSARTLYTFHKFSSYQGGRSEDQRGRRR